MLTHKRFLHAAQQDNAVVALLSPREEKASVNVSNKSANMKINVDVRSMVVNHEPNNLLPLKAKANFNAMGEPITQQASISANVRLNNAFIQCRWIQKSSLDMMNQPVEATATVTQLITR